MAGSMWSLRHLFNKSYSFSHRALHVQRFCIRNCETTDASASANSKTLEECFLNQHVQQILRKITGMDLKKIFQPVPHTLQAPKFKFVTDKELAALRAEAHDKALKKLEMPPVMSERKPIDEIIAKNPEIQGYERHRILFTDISPSCNFKDRTIVVRETNGILREANWDERFRMNQVYFPMCGRKMTAPRMFREDLLAAVLERKEYLFLLDAACVQYEPDDPEYIRVTHTVYNHINESKEFDVLRSTRHFGPLAFYLAYNNNVESLMVDMLERELLSDAADLVRLVYLFQSGDLQVDLKLDENPIDTVRNYISRCDSAQIPNLELAFQTYCEINKTETVLESTA